MRLVPVPPPFEPSSNSNSGGGGNSNNNDINDNFHNNIQTKIMKNYFLDIKSKVNANMDLIPVCISESST